jgi:hypothetical protein
MTVSFRNLQATEYPQHQRLSSNIVHLHISDKIIIFISSMQEQLEKLYQHSNSDLVSGEMRSCSKDIT